MKKPFSIKQLQKITAATREAEKKRDASFFSSKTRQNIIKNWKKPTHHEDLPLIELPDNYKIYVTDDAKDLRHWIRNDMDGNDVIGMDSEWLWYSKKHMLCDIVQLATKDSCILYQLAHKMRKEGKKYQYCEELHDFLYNEQVKKVFLAVDGDWNKLGYRDIKLPESVIDIDVEGVGAQRLCIEHLGSTLMKDPKVILSRWSRATLDEDQIQYASIDAYANLLLYEKDRVRNSVELHGGNAAALSAKRAEERAKRQALKREKKLQEKRKHQTEAKKDIL